MITNRLFNLFVVAASLLITACAPAVVPMPLSPPATSAPTVAASPVLEPNPETEVWSEGLPPNGTWQATLTPEDFVQRGILRSVAEEEWAGLYTWKFQDGKAQFNFEGTVKTGTFICLAEYAVVRDVVRFTPSIPSGTCDRVDDVQWQLEENGLHFHLVASNAAPLAALQTTYEAKPFQQIAD